MIIPTPLFYILWNYLYNDSRKLLRHLFVAWCELSETYVWIRIGRHQLVYLSDDMISGQKAMHPSMRAYKILIKVPKGWQQKCEPHVKDS